VRIGYAKLGRSIGLTPRKWGEVGGDNEPVILLDTLARRNPEVEWVIVGRNSRESPVEAGLPDNVTNPWTEWDVMSKKIIKETLGPPPKMGESDKSVRAQWSIAAARVFADASVDAYEDLDGLVLWLGQHGTSNSAIPMVAEPGVTTTPHEDSLYYAGPIIAGLNRWRDTHHDHEEVWLCPDVRNYLKARDVKHPPGSIMCQFDWSRRQKHWRYYDPAPAPTGVKSLQDNTIWEAEHHYTYSRLEIVGIPDEYTEPRPWEDRVRFGIVINEARKDGIRWTRLQAMLDWVLPLDPDWVHGTWSKTSAPRLGRVVTPIDWEEQWPMLNSTRCTFTTPSSGSGWATTKPWEAFKMGVVCFFHPQYDTQGNVIPLRDDPLSDWLRVTTPEILRKRVDHLSTRAGQSDWTWLVREQYRRYRQAADEKQAVCEIERRVGIGGS